MKKIVFVLLALTQLSFYANSQEPSNNNKVSGWNIGPLPCVSYSSDLGFQYGVCADAFYYGDGSRFPEYEHRFYIEASRYTKGQTLLHGQYDSKYLIPGLRVTAALSYQYDPLFAFYGFNGALQYDASKDLNRDTKLALYNHERKMFRGLFDVQGPITEHLNWAAGLSFWAFELGEFKTDKYLPQLSLYNMYTAAGWLPNAQGGKHMEAKIGLVYDSRDNESAPNKGIWAECYVNGSPALLGNESYLKFVAHFRQYLALGSERSVVAYHIGFQDTVLGQTPFYMLPVIYTLYLRQTSSEGLGGYNTVRGMLQNSLVGQGYLWANLEFRQRIVDFSFIGQNWYLALNPFVDAGYVSRTYKADVFGEGQRTAVSAGLGIKLAMNENFIISFECAKSLSHKTQPMGSSLVLNYIF